MRYSVRIIHREFPPKEAAEITKVSTVVQRDWRRRKILPERESDGWSVFDLKDIIAMSTTKSLSECGFSLSVAHDIALLSVLPVLGYLSLFPSNYEFEGLELSDEQIERIRITSVRGPVQRYLKVPLPPTDEAYRRMQRSDDLANFSDEEAEPTHFLVIDHSAIGNAIMDAVNAPLFRVVVEEVNG